MIYVYRRKKSDSGKALAESLSGKFVRRLPRVGSNDFVVAWGEYIPNALNGDAPVRSKLTDARILIDKEVKTIEWSEVALPGYVGRLRQHHGGNDLLRPPRRPEFWVKKEDLVKEYRVHIFDEEIMSEPTGQQLKTFGFLIIISLVSFGIATGVLFGWGGFFGYVGVVTLFSAWMMTQ